MNAKKAKEKRRKVERLKGYLNEAYELELKEWHLKEPKKIRFIAHYFWKKAQPKAPNYSPRTMKRSLK